MVPRRPSLVIARSEFVGGLFRRLHRQRRNAHEALRIFFDQFRDLVVLDRRGGSAKRGFLIVEIGLRCGGEHVHIHAGLIHVAQAMCDIEAAARKRPVGHAADLERRRQPRRSA